MGGVTSSKGGVANAAVRWDRYRKKIGYTKEG
jgi:hypothetical protein